MKERLTLALPKGRLLDAALELPAADLPHPPHEIVEVEPVERRPPAN